MNPTDLIPPQGTIIVFRPVVLLRPSWDACASPLELLNGPDVVVYCTER